VVSHDRYLIERVTDQQYAVIGGHFRHLPRGVEQYLELRAGKVHKAAAAPTASVTAGTARPRLGGADLRNAEKEFAAAGRKIEKLTGRVDQLHLQLAEHDQSDYQGLGALTTELQGIQAQLAEVETRWLELSELLG
jgi:ATPase subunit of ABC transporter with duplicated ATPase domains